MATRAKTGNRKGNIGPMRAFHKKVYKSVEERRKKISALRRKARGGDEAAVKTLKDTYFLREYTPEEIEEWEREHADK